MNLCILDLVQHTSGQLQLAAMPPREGELTALGRIVTRAADVQPGDVYWCWECGKASIEEAFLRGALGVVHAQRRVEPWPGRFCLQVDDPVAALARLVEGKLSQPQESSDNSPELKVLQLCDAAGADIYPSTCGQSAKGELARRCRRRAA